MIKDLSSHVGDINLIMVDALIDISLRRPKFLANENALVFYCWEMGIPGDSF